MRRLSAAGALACLLYAAPATESVRFEPKPRAVSVGRDPVIHVRASGAVSLLKVDGGNLFLETSNDGGDSFEEPVRVNSTDGEVSSHGESSPRMAIRNRGEFYIVWQARKQGGEGSELHFARSNGWGESFTKSIAVDPTSPSQNFFNLALSPQGIVYAAWLDGRDRGKGKAGSSAVYLARSVNKGVSFEPAVRVSLDSCPCCRPWISFSGESNVHVGWRRVLDENIRDIYISTSTDGGKTFAEGVRVAEDNWKINGCPHSGPAMASIGKRLFASWATVRDEKAQLYLAWSDDNGKTFTKRTSVADGVLDPNHPYLVPAGNKIALAFQGRMAKQNEGWGPIHTWYRELDGSGVLSPLERVGNLGASVSYPVVAYEEPGRVFVAWTETVHEKRSVVLSRGRRVKGAVNAR